MRWVLRCLRSFACAPLWLYQQLEMQLRYMVSSSSPGFPLLWLTNSVGMQAGTRQGPLAPSQQPMAWAVGLKLHLCPRGACAAAGSLWKLRRQLRRQPAGSWTSR